LCDFKWVNGNLFNQSSAGGYRLVPIFSCDNNAICNFRDILLIVSLGEIQNITSAKAGVLSGLSIVEVSVPRVVPG
jgi:hypothetical protein